MAQILQILFYLLNTVICDDWKLVFASVQRSSQPHGAWIYHPWKKAGGEDSQAPAAPSMMCLELEIRRGINLAGNPHTPIEMPALLGTKEILCKTGVLSKGHLEPSFRLITKIITRCASSQHLHHINSRVFLAEGLIEPTGRSAANRDLHPRPLIRGSTSPHGQRLSFESRSRQKLGEGNRSRSSTAHHDGGLHCIP